MTAAKKEEKVEDVEMKDAEEEKVGENCIFNSSFVFSGIVIDHKSSPYGYFLKVEKKDPNLLSVEDEDVS